MRYPEHDASPLIWITGAAGFIGSHAAVAFTARDWRVVGIARSPLSAVRSGQAAFADWTDGAVTSDVLENLIAKHGPPRAVFHAAGGSAVHLSYQNPTRDFMDNVVSTATLLDVLRRHSPEAILVLASSAAVYGQCGPAPISEEMAPAPVSPYGLHKRMAEDLCEQESRLSGMRTAIVRYFSVYGPTLRKQVVWDIVRRIRAGERHLELFGTGKETRDFLFIEDAVDLLYLIVSTTTDLHTIVNGGTGVATCIADLAALVKDVLSSDVLITFNGEQRAGDPKHFRACSARTASMGFQARTSLREGINRYRTSSSVESFDANAVP
jgi:UDP-glucose 4-epimerase